MSDIETVLAKKPSIIVSIPTDPVATATAYKKAAAAGVKLVFMDNVPNGMTAGKDYVSDVSADNYGNGVASAQLMARRSHGKGTIGARLPRGGLLRDAQRYEGFKNDDREVYPDIKIVAEKGIRGPNFSAQRRDGGVGDAHPSTPINGIWAVWDVPATGVISAARRPAATDLVIATEDLGVERRDPLARRRLRQAASEPSARSTRA